ncbi:hypothetical protein BASA83_008626 [Batrachochytrium salamandrivorans]|nr:hypothetical protein BASA83_008626 [Batrachochytrium salamandrivorans]
MIFRLGQDSKKSFGATLEKSIKNKSLKPRLHIEWNDAALRSQFYHGLSSEIKDALVHFDNPSSVSVAMDMAIRIDNRLFERRQEQRFSHQRPSSSYSSATPVTSRFRNQASNNKDSLKPDNLQIQFSQNSFINPSPVRPVQKSSDDMDIDFVRRGPLSSMERENRMKQGLCLVCGEAGHRKANCPKSRFKFKSDSSRNIYAIQTEENNGEISGNEFGCI